MAHAVVLIYNTRGCVWFMVIPVKYLVLSFSFDAMRHLVDILSYYMHHFILNIYRQAS